MKTMVRFFFLILTFMIISPSYAAEVSEASVAGFVAELDKAISTRNPDGVDRLMSPSANISGAVTMNGVRQAFRMNKAQYMQMLKSTWAQAEEYSYERTGTRIRVSGGRAMLSGTVIEKMRVGAERITSKSTETAVVELVGGRLQITDVKADGVVQ